MAGEQLALPSSLVIFPAGRIAEKKEKAREYQRAWYAANRERKASQYQERRSETRARQNAWYASNKSMFTEKNRIYYSENRDAILEKKRQYYKANRQKKSDRDRAYRATNAEVLAEKARAKRTQINAARKKRYKEQPVFRLRMTMSAAVQQSLRTGKCGSAWEKLVGYTVADLMLHLERQFLKGMSWNNRGKWHIDHIVPIASFTFSSPDDPDFKACWALTNLRPFWAKDNLSKNKIRFTLL